MIDDIKYSQSTSCPRCHQEVRWSEIDDDISGDDQFSGLIDKLRHHLKNDILCNRESKLKELLTGEKPPEWLKFYL